jgi:hypothetical protein
MNILLINLHVNFVHDIPHHIEHEQVLNDVHFRFDLDPHHSLIKNKSNDFN